MEIRRQVKQANPHVAAFVSERHGDDITLQFTVGEAPSRADFRLLGSKHDFYRLSMGVRLEETLTSLTQADPNIHPVAAAAADDQIRLRIGYAWPPGAEPPPPATESTETTPTATVPAPTPAGTAPVETAAAAPQPTAESKPPSQRGRYYVPAKPFPSPAGTDGQVAVSAPDQPPPLATAKVTETSAPEPPPPPPPPPPATTHEAEAAFQRALRTGTLQALVNFLEQHPNSEVAAEARKRADQMRELAAYNKALERNDVPGYRGFLENFPTSPHRGEIERRITSLEEARRVAEAERRQRQAEDKRRRSAYAEARKLDTPEAYRIFLKAYPDAPESSEANKRLRVIEEEDQAYQAARGSEQQLATFLALHPKGRHTQVARKEVQSLRSRRMEADYQRATETDTEAAYRSFLTEWPRSPKASAARAAIQRLQQQTESTPVATSAKEEGPALAPDTPHLRAVPVAAPPDVDGKADDTAWRSAPATTIPLHGKLHVAEVQVRAVHHDGQLYLHLTWADPSRDALYRPWVWDPTLRTYRQNNQLDDGAAVMLYREQPQQGSCMLHARDDRADTWIWRAYWSELSGLADDGSIHMSAERMPQSNPYPAANGSGQVWIRRKPDAGRAGWSFFVPLEFEGSVVPSYRANKGSGSRADISARGTWTSTRGDARWSVEYRRAFDTRHPDDHPLTLGTVHWVSFAVYDKSELGQHNSSPAVQLVIQGR